MQLAAVNGPSMRSIARAKLGRPSGRTSLRVKAFFNTGPKKSASSQAPADTKKAAPLFGGLLKSPKGAATIAEERVKAAEKTRKSIFGTSGTKQSSGQPGRQSPAQDQRARAQAAAEERKRQAEEQRARAQAAAKERKRQAEEQRARAQAAAEERKRQAEEQRARAQAAAEERKRQAEEQRRKQQEAMLAAQKAAAERKAALARASGSAKVATGSAKVPAGSAKMQTFAGSAKVAARPGTARGTARGEAKSASGTATRAAFGLFGQPKAVSTASQSPVDDKKRQMEEELANTRSAASEQAEELREARKLLQEAQREVQQAARSVQGPQAAVDKAGRRRSLLEEESQKLMGALEEATQRLAQLKRDRQALQQELSKPVVPLN